MRLYEVRRIIYDLRPMALDDLGLIPTLKKYLTKIDGYEKGAEHSFSKLWEITAFSYRYRGVDFQTYTGICVECTKTWTCEGHLGED